MRDNDNGPPSEHKYSSILALIRGPTPGSWQKLRIQSFQRLQIELTSMTALPDRIGCSTLEIAFMALENATILKGFLIGFCSSASLSR